MDIIDTQPPFRMLIIDCVDYRIIASNHSPEKNNGNKLGCCYQTLHNFDRPCHELNMRCPIEIVKNKKKSIKMERSYQGSQKQTIIAELNAIPIYNTENEVEFVALLSSNITRQKEMENKLLEKEAMLLDLDNELSETNRALSLMARKIESQRQNTQRHIVNIISSKVLPLVVKIREANKQKNLTDELNLIRVILNDIIASAVTGDVFITDKLSQTELKIANLICNGLTSEAISNQLFISVETVKTHRKSIRKKLGLRNSSTNLVTFMHRRYNRP